MHFLYFRGLGSDLFIYGPLSLFYLHYHPSCQLSSYIGEIQRSGTHFQNQIWQPFLSLPFLSARNTPGLLFLASVPHWSMKMRTRAVRDCAAKWQFSLTRAHVPAATQTRANRSGWIMEGRWVRRSSRYSALAAQVFSNITQKPWPGRDPKRDSEVDDGGGLAFSPGVF